MFENYEFVNSEYIGMLSVRSFTDDWPYLFSFSILNLFSSRILRKMNIISRAFLNNEAGNYACVWFFWAVLTDLYISGLRGLITFQLREPSPKRWCRHFQHWTLRVLLLMTATCVFNRIAGDLWVLLVHFFRYVRAIRVSFRFCTPLPANR